MGKIIGYAKVKAENLISVHEMASIYTIKEDEDIRQIKQQPNVVECIALRDIDSFGTYQELSDEEYEIVHKEGFILNGMDEDGRCLYVREDVLI